MFYTIKLCKGLIVKSLTADKSFSYASENTFHKPFGKIGTVTSQTMKTLTGLTVKKGDEYSCFECGVEQSEFLGFAGTPYNAVIVSPYSLNEKGQAAYSPDIIGWIDTTEEISISAKINTRVYWHVDHWLTALTWGDRMPSLLEGRIKRGPAVLARPESVQPRLWESAQKFDIATESEKGAPWVIVLHTTNYTDAKGETFTFFYVTFWPTERTLSVVENEQTYSCQTIKINTVYGGLTEEYLGLNADSIVGIWFSPIPPCDVSVLSPERYKPASATSTGYGFYRVTAGISYFGTPQKCINTPEEIKTDDNSKWVIIDPYLSVYGTLPWGQSSTSVYASIDIGTSGAFMTLDFRDGSTEAGTGRQIQVPLISAPITSNAMSSYVLSGQREYDIYTAQLQAEQSRKSGIANSGTSALSGAVGGAVAGGGIGAAIGAVAGLATSLIGTQVNYQLTKDFDSKTQEATDKLTSNQTASVLISGGGNSWIKNTWQIIRLTRDAQSKTELTDEQANLGFATDCYSHSCADYIGMGGGIRIESLHVEGCSPEGNKYIQSMFSSGCHIDLLQEPVQIIPSKEWWNASALFNYTDGCILTINESILIVNDSLMYALTIETSSETVSVGVGQTSAALSPADGSELTLKYSDIDTSVKFKVKMVG